MLARYLPSLDLRAWLRFLTASPPAAAEARARLLGRLGIPAGRFEHVLGFAGGRYALLSYFAALHAQGGPGEVLVSAQMCPLVASVVEQCGFTPRFVDVSPSLPCPTPAQFAAAVTPDTRAVVVSPMYGYLDDGWQAFPASLASVRLVLDLCQGLEARAVQPLIERADAIVYSFNLGKGVDTGGGLLLTSLPVRRPRRTHGRLPYLRTLLKCLALRALVATGLYGAVVGRLDREVEQDKAPLRDADPLVDSAAPAAAFVLWDEGLRRFLDATAVARRRAADLDASTGLRSACSQLHAYSTADAAFLRLLLPFDSPDACDHVRRRLRARGVDCLQAGEPLPAGVYPNARAFCGRALRLPFVGRLTEAQFARLRAALEESLVGLPR